MRPKNVYNLLIYFLLFVSCGTSTSKKPTVVRQNSIIKEEKIECDFFGKDNIDSIIPFGDDTLKIEAYTSCFGDFIIRDTIFYTDTTINLHQDRRLNIILNSKNNDFSIILEKDEFKELYEGDESFDKSILTRPFIKDIDLENQKIYFTIFFSFPHSVEGDFGESILFSVDFKGSISEKQFLQDN